MPTDQRFPDLVALACHDLRTPLATVAGFAATLLRMGQLDEPSTRYVGLIESAAKQLGQIVDDLSVVARIQSGRLEPAVETVDTLALAGEAARQLPDGLVAAHGSGAPAAVDPRLTTRALAALANAALRHGALERVELEVDGRTVLLPAVNDEATEVVLGSSPRDLGALAGNDLIAAIGGRVEQRNGVVAVTLPAPG
jgi:signal transduction histidine kinase